MNGTVGKLVTVYVLIGLGIVLVQNYTATGCDSLMGQIYQVRANEPFRMNQGLGGLARVLLWPVNLYANVWQHRVPIGEFLSPRICVDGS